MESVPPMNRILKWPLIFQWIGFVGKILTGNPWVFYHQIGWGFRLKIFPSSNSVTFGTIAQLDFEDVHWKPPLSSVSFQPCLIEDISDSLSGWWLTYPSEKYEFVSWDYSSQLNGTKCSIPPIR